MNKYLIIKFSALIIDQQRIVDNLKSTDKEYIKNKMKLKKLYESLRIISDYPKKILKGEDLQHIKGIGKGTIDRINYILKFKKSNSELEKVYGIGKKNIVKFQEMGIDTFEKLLQAKNNGMKLSKQILIGIKYFNKYKINIPRIEITYINKYLKSILKKINKNLSIEVCGSYRRKNKTSDDIDILLFNKTQVKSKDIKINNYLKIFVEILEKKNFLLDNLSFGDTKYSGFCKFGKQPIRRIDIRYIPYESLYTSLLYFTGSYKFNIYIRKIAIKKGYKLNEYQLYNNKLKKKEIIKSEKEIFDILGIEYVPPENR